MNTKIRRVLLALTIFIGLYVGIWGYAFPEAFYDSFPGWGMEWIHFDGPYNEHFVRDVGSLYIALGVGSIVALVSRSAVPGRLMGVLWTVFGVLHFGYHVLHPEGTAGDIVGSLISLIITAVLGIALMFPLGVEPANARSSEGRAS